MKTDTASAKRLLANWMAEDAEAVECEALREDDKSMTKTPTIERFAPRHVGDKTWGIELLVAHTPEYIGKVLYMKAGKGGNLQYHQTKDETFHLFSGTAMVVCEIDGTRETMVMRSGESYHVPPGAVHGVTAVSDCVFFETSTPVFDDRVIVENAFDCI